MINVTMSFLPPLAEYTKYLESIWERCHLTNHGPLVFELEERLKEYFGVKHVFLMTNGTVALQIAIRAADLKGEVITTPFSYVATTSSLVWERCKPVFADIDETTFCISPAEIRKNITSETTGILATHVYGYPCPVDEIEKIAAEYNLKVIYDAAHGFGCRYQGKSLASYGDISMVSFHATKLFHTIEGGALFTNKDDLAHKISHMRNFGHNGPEDFWEVGINGKSSEFQAAMGLAVFPYLDNIISSRKERSDQYREELKSTSIRIPNVPAGLEFNYGYFPVFFSKESDLLAVKTALNAYQVYPRRYFYPSLNTVNYVEPQSCPVSEELSSRALCLPLYPDLKPAEVKMICRIIRETMDRL
ncbi:MAG: DegT/DnrJ/EryC1/StrS family aminotransferase [Bacteroidetes bacterium]|nr:DegT/DnrJ/EryC1/StrS family aminotransferase [Bacteroidota bacterium]